jgi:hypothetical protein
MLRTLLSIKTGTENTAKKFQTSEKQSGINPILGVGEEMWAERRADAHDDDIVCIGTLRE